MLIPPSPPLATVPEPTPSPPLATVPEPTPSPPLATVPEPTPSPPLATVPEPTPSPPLATVPEPPPLASSQTIKPNTLRINSINASGEQVPNIAANVLDGNQSTRWSNEGTGSWIQVDVGSKKTITGIGIAWYKGAERQYNFEVSVSDTPVDSGFTKILNETSTGTTNLIERYNLDSEARYIKITVNGNTDQKVTSTQWASIVDLELYSNEENAEIAQTVDTKVNQDINENTLGLTNGRVVMINFDDGWKNQYTSAKPVLDKYGFKATFFVVCNYIGDKDRMNWEEIEALNREGHDIGSHTMNHVNLDEVSSKDISYEISGSKQCLLDHGINASSFAYPFNDGVNNKYVVETVAKFFDLARSGGQPLTYLQCDRTSDTSNNNDCRYSLSALSHEIEQTENSYTDTEMLSRFIELVSTQAKFNNNKNGTINAIPIIVYHRVGPTDDYSTSLSLIEAEMKYLFDNHYSVLTFEDIGYDQGNDRLYVKPVKSTSEVRSLSSGLKY
jgi:peptidoglycan/xylan/chitin deacetylase (PgdA/CDA1 family)